MKNYGLEITQRPDLPAVLARWHREITTVELKAGYKAILDSADDCQCWRWLLDVRRREEIIMPEVAEWMRQEFFTQLAGRYENPVRLALLVSPSREQRMSRTATTTESAGEGYVIATFTDEASAFEWLAR